MRKKIWFFLFIVQSILLAGVISVFFWSSLLSVRVKNSNIQSYLEQEEKYGNWMPEVGFISDVKTAKIVGSRIIDRLTGHSWFGVTVVEYDETNRLWKVNKGYLFGNGGCIVIEQDSGKIIKALLSK